MSRTWHFLVSFLLMLGFLGLLGALGYGLYEAGVHPVIIIVGVLGILVLYGCVLFLFLRYRIGRQEEFLHVLTTVMEANAPLAPALRAYVQDRPHDTAREIWTGALLFLVLPGYYWVWHRQRNFDRRVEAVAHLLEEGVPLYHALLVTPGVVSRETLLAVAMGEITGQMTLCLRGAARSRIAAVWLEALPRVIYPALVLLAMLACVGFLQVFILPKMDRIVRDMGLKLPWLTDKVFELWGAFLTGLVLVLLTVGTLGGLLLLSSVARWYFPLLGRVYRMHVQGRVLRMLGALLGAGKPVPEAMALLADTGYFSLAAEWRLDACRHRLGQGESLSSSLSASGLLPANMVPLVQAAERAHNLPWALGELGENLSGRTVRLVKRVSMTASPVITLLIGLVVGFIVIGMFLPLVKIMEALSV